MTINFKEFIGHLNNGNKNPTGNNPVGFLHKIFYGERTPNLA
jgi:hypothetical protein